MAECPDERLASGLLELADKTIQWAEDTTDVSRVKSFHGFGHSGRCRRGSGGNSTPPSDRRTRPRPILPRPSSWSRSNRRCGLQRAGFYIEQGKWEQALADFEKALEVRPANAGNCNNLAWYLATCPDPRTGGSRSAMSSWPRKSTELAPNDGHALEHFGHSPVPSRSIQ